MPIRREAPPVAGHQLLGGVTGTALMALRRDYSRLDPEALGRHAAVRERPLPMRGWSWMVPVALLAALLIAGVAVTRGGRRATPPSKHAMPAAHAGAATDLSWSRSRKRSTPG